MLLGVAVIVGVAVFVRVAVTVGVFVAVGDGPVVAVFVTVGVAVFVAVGAVVAVLVGVSVGVLVSMVPVGVGLGLTTLVHRVVWLFAPGCSPVAGFTTTVFFNWLGQPALAVGDGMLVTSTVKIIVWLWPGFRPFEVQITVTASWTTHGADAEFVVAPKPMVSTTCWASAKAPPTLLTVIV